MSQRKTHRALITACVLTAVALSTSASEPPASKQLFADEKWYRETPVSEQVFEGVIYKEPGPMATSGRWNPVRLRMDETIREVYLGGKTDLLDAHTGRRVRIIGKPMDMNVTGQRHEEIWPARIELLPDKEKDRIQQAPPDT